MNDKQGRPYAKLSELRAGDVLELDEGFTCMRSRTVTVQGDELGLYFNCNDGRHSLSQATDFLVGMYRA